MNPYDDLPDTTVYLPALSSLYSGPGPGVCGCQLPASCDECDGTAQERRDMWRMPRAERRALELANLRLSPHWQALHGTDDTTGSAA